MRYKPRCDAFWESKIWKNCLHKIIFFQLIKRPSVWSRFVYWSISVSNSTISQTVNTTNGDGFIRNNNEVHNLNSQYQSILQKKGGKGFRYELFGCWSVCRWRELIWIVVLWKIKIIITWYIFVAMMCCLS